MYSIYAMTVMEDFTISDFAQAFVLGLGAISALLLVIWQSRCLCRCRIGISDQCYIFDCQRSPPPLKEDKKEEELAEEQEQEQEENPEDPVDPVNP
tara:strand:+ start:112 stop:399 length:288 start_codon:yes stop_codon:yes gene_type:complete